MGEALISTEVRGRVIICGSSTTPETSFLLTFEGGDCTVLNPSVGADGAIANGGGARPPSAVEGREDEVE